MLSLIYRIIFLCLLSTAFSSSIYAANAPAGYVVVVSGTVMAQATDGTSRTLSRRSPVYEGETILTGSNTVQIRFADGSLTSLRRGTEFKVESFTWSGEEDGSEKGFFSLFKGGLRTLTGSIGKANNENYKMVTPVATIGIRGTFYRLRLCDGDCGTENQTGLFGGVAEGRINVSNIAGDQDFSAGGFFQVSGQDVLPEELLEPPEFFNDSDEAERDVSEEEEEREGRNGRKQGKGRDDDRRDGEQDRDDDREAGDQDEREEDDRESREQRGDAEEQDNRGADEDWEEWDDRNDQDDRDDDRDSRRGPDDRDDRRDGRRGGPRESDDDDRDSGRGPDDQDESRDEPDDYDDLEGSDDVHEEDNWDDPEYQEQEDLYINPPSLPGDNNAPQNNEPIQTRNTTFISFLAKDETSEIDNQFYGIRATITERASAQDTGESFVKETVFAEDAGVDEDNVITRATFNSGSVCRPCTFSRTDSTTAITDFDKYNATEYKVDIGAWEASRWTIDNLYDSSPAGTLWFASSDYITTQTELDALSGQRATFNGGLQGDFSDQAGVHGDMKNQSLSFVADFTDQAIEGFKLHLQLNGVDTGTVQQGSEPVSFVDARNAGISLRGENCVGCAGSNIISGRSTVEFLGPNAPAAMGTFTLRNQSQENAFTGAYVVQQEN